MFTYGSWKEGDATGGVGWVLQLTGRETELLGLKGFSRSLSSLHAELTNVIQVPDGEIACLHTVRGRKETPPVGWDGFSNLPAEKQSF
ncbi:unnamed protein product [Cochlearia groenlandica]